MAGRQARLFFSTWPGAIRKPRRYLPSDPQEARVRSLPREGPAPRLVRVLQISLDAELSKPRAERTTPVGLDCPFASGSTDTKQASASTGATGQLLVSNGVESTPP